MTALESFNQLTLLDPQALTNPVTDPSATHAERFAAFHQANPHVFDNLARIDHERGSYALLGKRLMDARRLLDKDTDHG